MRLCLDQGRAKRGGNLRSLVFRLVEGATVKASLLLREFFPKIRMWHQDSLRRLHELIVIRGAQT